jgi:hypothetical protein
MQEEKVVKVPEGLYPGFPHMEGTTIGFSRQSRRVRVFDIGYGFSFRMRAKNLGSPQRISMDWMEQPERFAGRQYSRNFLQYR